MKPAEARRRLEQLETEHGPRRKWVWTARHVPVS